MSFISFALRSLNRVINFQVGIEEVDCLKPHEEAIEDSLKRLIKTLKKCRFQKHPIIVDRDSKVILDGMHRWYAFKQLNIKHIGVCYVKYFDESIGLGRWLRVAKGTRISPGKIVEVFRLNLKRKGFDFSETRIQNIMDVKDIPSILVPEINVAFIIYNNEDKVSLFRKIHEMFKETVESINLKMDFIPDISLSSKIEKEILAIAVMPKVSKSDVVHAAGRGLLFPPKSTRHEIPARPMMVNFPINLLKSSGTKDKVNAYLRALMRNRNAIHISPGLEMDRKYAEDLVLFWESRWFTVE